LIIIAEIVENHFKYLILKGFNMSIFAQSKSNFIKNSDKNTTPGASNQTG